MNKTRSIIVAILAIGLLVISCKSNEEKANELIKDYMYKSLYDYDSYQSIETKIEKAYVSPYYDESIIGIASLVVAGMEKEQKYMEEVNNARRTAEIWMDSYSSYGREKTKEALAEAKEGMRQVALNLQVICKLLVTLKEKIDNLDTEKRQGWKVTHTFRCKTRGGHSDLGTYVFIMDEKFKSILYNEDINDESLKKAKSTIDHVRESTKDELDKMLENANEQCKNYLDE